MIDTSKTVAEFRAEFERKKRRDDIVLRSSLAAAALIAVLGVPWVQRAPRLARRATSAARAGCAGRADERSVFPSTIPVVPAM